MRIRAIEQILPENHIFMGNVYFYGKIVSMFGSNLKKGKGPGQDHEVHDAFRDDEGL